MRRRSALFSLMGLVGLLLAASLLAAKAGSTDHNRGASRASSTRTVRSTTLSSTTVPSSCGDPTGTEVANNRVLSTCTVGTSGITLSPAPPGLVPLVSAGSAVASLPPFIGSSFAPTAVLFGLMTDSGGMATIEPDGTAVPNYVDSPTWIVEYLNVPMYPTGGPVRGTNGSGTNKPVQKYVGTWFVFMNPDTGQYEFAHGG
jgi:hypothetical protein